MLVTIIQNFHKSINGIREKYLTRRFQLFSGFFLFL